jgi:hypothetical protein
MSQAYKKMLRKLQLLNKLILCFLFLASCVVRQERRLTEREVIYQKGLSLFSSSKYLESAAFFLKVAQNPEDDSDELYNSSLWNLSLVYERYGEFDKSILALQELERRKPATISLFKIQLSLMKNYIRIGNQKVSDDYRKKIDNTSPIDRYGINEIYFSLLENVSFNYDQVMVEELKFLGDTQKYFIFIMEKKTPSLSDKATELLITLYDGFFIALERDTFNRQFKKTLAIELLEQLRRFDYYKLDEPQLNLKTIAKFSHYSNEKQKYLTKWLYSE